MGDVIDVITIDSEKAQQLKTVGWVSYILHLIDGGGRHHSGRAGWRRAADHCAGDGSG